MPYKSLSQMRWAHTKEGIKALGGKDKVAEWDAASKGMKLPKKTKKKYQVGGEMEDSGFFGLLAQLAQQQAQSPQPEEDTIIPQEETDDTKGVDYEDLQSQLEDIKSQLNEFKSSYDPMMNKSSQDDEFVKFMFDDSDNNEPTLFGETPKFGNSFSLHSNEPIGNKALAAFDFFKQKGLPDHIAAGIAGNLKHESGFNPNAVGDGGKAKGLAQWHPDRYNRLTQEGFNLNNFNDNLEAIYHELNTTEKSAYEKLLQTTSPEEAAMVFDKTYERSAGLSTKQRAATASSIFNVGKGKYQAGGVIAQTPEDLHTGLNNEDFSHMILDLPNKENIIRGLDKGKVLVMDNKGKQTILHNSKQTTKVRGKAYEIRL